MAYRNLEDQKAYQNEYRRRPERKEANRLASQKYRASAKGIAKTSESWRTWFLKGRYGITEEYYQSLVEAQHGVCAICRKAPVGRGRNGRKLHIDHDHATGKLRDLLCSRCNSGLGYFCDEIGLLLAAAMYLERHGKK